MSAPTEIIEKIKKLLRLARSSNPHEAQLAMQRAMELARAHDVAVDGLNPEEQAKEKSVTHQDTIAKARLSYDQRYALVICQRFFHVTPVTRQKIERVDGWPRLRNFVTFVGTTSDIEISLYVFGFLVQHFTFCWRKHRGRLRNRHAFIEGMFQGIYSKLKECEPAPVPRQVKGNELALSDQRNYIGALIGETKSTPVGKPDGDARAASWAGYVHGRRTTIAPALKPSDEPAPLLLT